MIISTLMQHFLKQLYLSANRNTGKLFLIGFLGVIFYNWWAWQRDKTLLNRQSLPDKLPPLDSWPNLPLVSILVPAWNEVENIEQHIHSFNSLRYPQKELILSAGGEDGTYHLAQRSAGHGIVVLRQLPGEGKQRALQRSFSKSMGSIIYLTDADCLLDNDSFEQLVYQIVSQGEEAVSGSSRPSQRESSNPFIISQAASQIYSSMHSPSYASGLLGRNCSVTRELLERSHALEVPAPSGTDYVMAKMIYQTGACIRQLPDCRVVTEYPTSMSEYTRQQRRWLNNVAHYGKQFGARNEIRTVYSATLIGMGMLFLPFIGLFTSKLRLVTWLLFFSHALISRMRYLHFSSNLLDISTNFRSVLFQPIFLLLDFSVWVRSWMDNITPGKWQAW
jgi:cellulose synthase/poly-beta-1,6-N-acetylglucosamine synthase-like glycosyltransferase